MAYKGLNNKTDAEAELALLADENGRDVLLVLVKNTFDIADDGSLSFSEEQLPICMEGEYFEEPGQSSLKIAPEANFDKLATDVVLVGHAHAPPSENDQPIVQFDVGLQVGNLRQHIRVFGDRVWEKRTTANKIETWHMSAPQPIEKIPLIYENAFGGQDLSPEDEAFYAHEARNLLGKGVISKHSQMEKVALPNLEDPKQLIKTTEDKPMPVSMGFVSPEWQPRLGFSGTYDKAWEKTRLPMLPLDFKRDFFNAAHPNLTAKGFLDGSEVVHIINACEQGKLSFQLPECEPSIAITFQYEEQKKLNVKLDTVMIDTDDMKLTMLWRATEDVINRIYDMEEIVVDEKQEEQKQIIPDDYELMA